MPSCMYVCTHRNGARPITGRDRRLSGRGNRWTRAGTGRRGQLAGAPALDLDLVDVQVVAGAGRIGPEAQMRVPTAGAGGQGHDVEAHVLVVEVARRLLVAGAGRLCLRAAVLPPPQLDPGAATAAGLARRGIVGAVLEVEVLVVLEGPDVPPEPDAVDVVRGRGEGPSGRGGQVEEGAGVHPAVVDEADGAGRQAEGPQPVVVEGGPARVGVSQSWGEVLPCSIVKVVDEDGGPVPVNIGIEGRDGAAHDVGLGRRRPDEVVVESAAGAAEAVVQRLVDRAEPGPGDLGADGRGLVVRAAGTVRDALRGGAPLRTLGVRTNEARSAERQGLAGQRYVPATCEIVRRLGRVGVRAAADLVDGIVGREVAHVAGRAATDPAAFDKVRGGRLELPAGVGTSADHF